MPENIRGCIRAITWGAIKKITVKMLNQGRLDLDEIEFGPTFFPPYRDKCRSQADIRVGEDYRS